MLAARRRRPRAAGAGRARRGRPRRARRRARRAGRRRAPRSRRARGGAGRRRRPDDGLELAGARRRPAPACCRRARAADRARPPHRPPGRHHRRAGAAAPPRRRPTPSGASPATCSPASCPGELEGEELRRRLRAVRARRPHHRARRREADLAAPRWRTRSATAASSPAAARSSARCSRRRRRRRSRSPSASARRRRACAAGREPPGRRSPTPAAASTRRAGRSSAPRSTPTTTAPVHLPRPRLLPAAARDAGRRRPAHVLRLHPRPARERRTTGYAAELLRSLEVFIECNGQWERAARQLSCHRHTLRYRIQRVEQLTGRSLDSARDRIDFWLALRGRESSLSTRTSRQLNRRHPCASASPRRSRRTSTASR